MTTITTRVVKTRDAATSILRKLGLKPNMYGLFMKKLDDGRFEVDLPKIYEQGYGVNGAIKAEKPAAAAKVKAEKPVKAKAEKTVRVWLEGDRVILPANKKEGWPEQHGSYMGPSGNGVSVVCVDVKFRDGKKDDGLREVETKRIRSASAPKAEKTAKEPKAKKEPKARRVSVSSVAEELLLAGKTNEEVFAVLKEKFKLDDSKKNYPSWYRCRLKRQKRLAEEKS